MEQKAHVEFDKFDKNRRIEADQVPSDFDKFVEETKKTTSAKPKKR
jgi:hypothetical protein